MPVSTVSSTASLEPTEQVARAELLEELALVAARDDARHGDTLLIPDVRTVTHLARVAADRGIRLALVHRTQDIPTGGRAFLFFARPLTDEQRAACHELAQSNRLALCASPRRSEPRPEFDFGLHHLVAERDADGIRLTFAATCPSSPLWVLVDPAVLAAESTVTEADAAEDDSPSDSMAWIEAARSYLSAGFPEAAKAALARAGTDDPGVRQQAERQQRLDAEIARAVTTSEHPVLPVIGAGADPGIATLPAPLSQMGPVRFSQMLDDEVLAGAVEKVLRVFVLRSVADGATLLDLTPHDGHLAIAVCLAGLPAPVVVERSAVRRRVLAAADSGGSPVRIYADVSAALTTLTGESTHAHILVHATLATMTDGSLTSTVLALRAARRGFSVVVSEVNSVVAARDATVDRLLSLAPLLDLEVRSVALHGAQLVVGTLADYPRPQLLFAC